MAAAQMNYQTTSLDSIPAAKKRKRGGNSEDVNSAKRGDMSEINGSVTNENGITDANAFSEANAGSNNPFPSHSQQSHDENAAMAAALQAHGQQMSASYSSGIQHSGFEMGSPGQGAPSPYMDAQYQGHGPQTPTNQGQVGSPSGGSGNKPTVGSEEWHKVRRDNHKEVERRRRETINEGINELAKIVPGNEKNKGSILARTVSYIRDLQANQATSQDQRTLERQLLEQAVDELTTANESLKQRNHELETDSEFYRSSVARLMQKVKDLGGSLQEEENAGVVAKIEEGKH